MKHKTVVYPNVHHISIHVDKLISEHFVTEDYKDHLTDKTKPAMDEILSVDGVVGCGMKKYEITITKGEMFNWSSIIPTILNIVNRRFYGQDVLPGDYSFFNFEKPSYGIMGDFIDDVTYKQTEQEQRQEMYDDLY